MDPVSLLESRVVPRLQDFAEGLRTLFPSLKAQVCSYPVGSLTEWQGHSVCIDCLLADVPIDRPDNIALSVFVFHLTTDPMIFADVVWGHPSGSIVDEFSEDPVPFSDDMLSRIELVLPRLSGSLEKAIRMGPPL